MSAAGDPDTRKKAAADADHRQALRAHIRLVLTKINARPAQAAAGTSTGATGR
jgi:hypothetical protein